MKKKIYSTVVTVALLTISGGIANVHAADGDFTPRKHLWNDLSGNTTAYYELDMVRALAKEDTRTALEA